MNNLIADLKSQYVRSFCYAACRLIQDAVFVASVSKYENADTFDSIYTAVIYTLTQRLEDLKLNSKNNEKI